VTSGHRRPAESRQLFGRGDFDRLDPQLLQKRFQRRIAGEECDRERVFDRLRFRVKRHVITVASRLAAAVEERKLELSGAG